MRKVLLAFVWLGLIFSIIAGSAWALRCGRDLISVGDRKLEVLHACGEPDLVDVWEERQRNDIYFYGHWYPNTETVVIEVWSYNFGPSRFMRTLRFENGELTEIETLGYGFSTP